MMKKWSVLSSFMFVDKLPYLSSYSPNNGFLSQLRLFEKMGYELDTDHVEYKTFKLKILSSNIQSGELFIMNVLTIVFMKIIVLIQI